MGKSDKAAASNVIDQNAAINQPMLNNLATQNATQTGINQGNAAAGTARDTASYDSGMAGYNNFLASMPNSGNLYSQFLGPSYNSSPPSIGTGAVTTQPVPGGATQATDTPINPLTGDPTQDAVLALYNKYGIKVGPKGSGLADLSYWSGDAVSNAKGDTGYTLGRLESDLAGTGPDAASGGSAPLGNAGAVNKAISGYSNFADTGGFSQADLQNIRARSIAPIRTNAEQARQEIQRQSGLRGAGYSPNAIAAIAKTARDADYATGDTATNAEANIAQMTQQGKLYGLQGLSSTGATGRGQDLSAITSTGQESLGAMSGQTSLYGATPGLAKTFGDQALASSGQGIQVAGLQGTYSQQQIDDAIKMGDMKGIPWKQILATTAGVVAIAATGGLASPIVAPVIAGMYAANK